VRGALLLASAAACAVLGIPQAAQAEPVLLISIDGLRPADVTDAEARGLKVPNLRRFVREGAHAEGVIGVLPTVTYPSHTTLVTGTSPATNGIVGNNTFDPLAINAGGWFWYASDIKSPTLWDAVKGAGKTSASIHWPVTVGAASIDWNVPQYWRSGHADDAKLIAALSTPGLLAELEGALGTYAAGIDESIASDENRGAFVAEVITRKHPYFMTAYLTALDHEQHAKGPGTPEAHAVLERLDAIVGKLVAAQLAAQPDSVIAVVSDHGFSTTTTEVNFPRAFIDAGLITLGADGKIASWDATPWPAGGSVAVVLARPDDAALKAKVAALLAKLKADPAMHIRTIADEAEIARLGGNPQASFYIDMQLDATTGGFKGADAPLSAPSTGKGTHGYFPSAPALRSTFMLMGSGIPAGKSLGEIDMRSIAPTLAGILEVPLPTAEKPAVDLRP
jgi:predicted AlkP superfamily pyrophosphatase or phosphodiesterase